MTLYLVAVETAGLYALWTAINDLRTGKAATTKTWTIDYAYNPVGFCVAVALKLAFVGFAIAMLLHAVGLIGDPLEVPRQVFPFFSRRQTAPSAG